MNGQLTGHGNYRIGQRLMKLRWWNEKDFRLWLISTSKSCLLYRDGCLKTAASGLDRIKGPWKVPIWLREWIVVGWKFMMRLSNWVRCLRRRVPSDFNSNWISGFPDSLPLVLLQMNSDLKKRWSICIAEVKTRGFVLTFHYASCRYQMPAWDSTLHRMGTLSRGWVEWRIIIAVRLRMLGEGKVKKDRCRGVNPEIEIEGSEFFVIGLGRWNKVNWLSCPEHDLQTFVSRLLISNSLSILPQNSSKNFLLPS